MSWMFRWLDVLIARLPRARDDSDRWVQPSNAITRAITAASFAPLAVEAPATQSVDVEVDAPVPAEVEAPAAAAAPAKGKSKRAAA